MMKRFYARDSRKALRIAMKANIELRNDGVEHAELLEYLEDMAAYFAEQRPDEEAHARAYVLRAMAALAHQNADAIYAPYGYENPFLPSKPEVQEDKSKRSVWNYPIINYPPAGASGSFDLGEFQEYSALKMFGYTVGKTKGWPLSKRQSFLSAFMESVLPPIVEVTFPGQYGTPMSAHRLRKIANVIAANANNFARKDAEIYAVAIADWETDLQFLKQKYYEGAVLKFQPWPDPPSKR